jgi:hypothetical protein
MASTNKRYPLVLVILIASVVSDAKLTHHKRSRRAISDRMATTDQILKHKRGTSLPLVDTQSKLLLVRGAAAQTGASHKWLIDEDNRVPLDEQRRLQDRRRTRARRHFPNPYQEPNYDFLTNVIQSQYTEKEIDSIATGRRKDDTENEGMDSKSDGDSGDMIDGDDEDDGDAISNGKKGYSAPSDDVSDDIFDDDHISTGVKGKRGKGGKKGGDDGNQGDDDDSGTSPSYKKKTGKKKANKNANKKKAKKEKKSKHRSVDKKSKDKQVKPTPAPTYEPSLLPGGSQPTMYPTISPTPGPTSAPTPGPTVQPVVRPTPFPTTPAPTSGSGQPVMPTIQPVDLPQPPTSSPISPPTSSPTLSPVKNIPMVPTVSPGPSISGVDLPADCDNEKEDGCRDPRPIEDD